MSSFTVNKHNVYRRYARKVFGFLNANDEGRGMVVASRMGGRLLILMVKKQLGAPGFVLGD